ncbi:cation diffusion facilitator family transporter [Bdellovibrio sp. HCB288]|uniref:cation diffusion facilitator family transporter n=1 Tax=Bdellovibrio sp. HCB288 TaxID=3394355 RepID=UPI0039B59DE1
MVTQSITVSDKIRNRAAWVSALASIAIFSLKVAAYRMTGSAAVLSDALESIVNVVASLVALYVIRISAQPADREHPYGHGKAEYFSATFEGGLVLSASILIIYESVKSLIFPAPPQKLEIGMAIVSVAALLNLLLGLYLKHVGKTHQSDALKASGVHVLSDVITTAGVIVGLGLVLLTDIQWIDPVIAILIGLHLAWSGYNIVRESMGGLMDEISESSLQDLCGALEKNRQPGIINIHQLRIMRNGRFHHVDAHLVVPEYWDISKAHGETLEFEKSVVKDYVFDGELAFHLDPCKKSYCPECDMPDCPIRLQPYQSRTPFTVKSLTAEVPESN